MRLYSVMGFECWGSNTEYPHSLPARPPPILPSTRVSVIGFLIQNQKDKYVNLKFMVPTD